MHYPHPKNEYEAGLRRVAEGIEMARRGAYRDGYLKMILEALECLEQMAHQVGMYQRDGGMSLLRVPVRQVEYYLHNVRRSCHNHPVQVYWIPSPKPR